MKLPDPRGPLGAAVNDHLGGHAVDLRQHHDVHGYADDDRALSLWTLSELVFRGFDGVDPDLEFDGDVVTLRGLLETDLETSLRADHAAWAGPTAFWQMIEHDDPRPSLSAFLRRDATADDVLTVLKQKSLYHLKESDPHCFVLPRLDAGPKAALAEIQYDELGGGDPDRVHSLLFAQALEAAGLDPTYGAYVNEATTATLTAANALTMLCLRRRLRNAAVGHLAAFEATSSLPCADIVRGLRRLGFDERVVRYYDEHVEADAVHEQLAWHDLCGRVIADDPAAEPEIMFGVFVCLELEARAGAELVESLR